MTDALGDRLTSAIAHAEHCHALDEHELSTSICCMRAGHRGLHEWQGHATKPPKVTTKTINLTRRRNESDDYHAAQRFSNGRQAWLAPIDIGPATWNALGRPNDIWVTVSLEDPR